MTAAASKHQLRRAAVHRDVLRPSATTPNGFGYFCRNKSTSSGRTKPERNEVVDITDNNGHCQIVSCVICNIVR